MSYNIELYKNNEYFCAYIGKDNGNGYEVYGNTENECASKIAQYFKDYGKWGNNDEKMEEN